MCGELPSFRNLRDLVDFRMRILFVHNHPTHFVRIDRQLLASSYLVEELYIRSRRHSPANIWQQVLSCDVVVGWFASWHTFLPMLFARVLRRPSLLIIGGYDLAKLPEVGYGLQRGGAKKWMSQATMRLATQLVTNAHYSRQEAADNAGIPPQRVAVVHHGLADPFGELPVKNGKPLALTVGNVRNENLWRKGHEPFVRAAALLPDVEFVLVGRWREDEPGGSAIDRLRAMATPNVTFTGWVEAEELLDYYRRAHTYVQASAHEGFGMSVAEAMLAGCIPAVTRRGALPEVVGDAGVGISSQTPEAVATAVTQSLNALPQQREHARERILREFPLEKRAALLNHVLKDLSR